MPHMNEVFELLKDAHGYLIMYSNLREEMSLSPFNNMEELLGKIDQILHEWEMLKTGHLART